jgi:hypothetical protein
VGYFCPQINDHMNHARLIFLSILFSITAPVLAWSKKDTAGKPAVAKVLIVGLRDNVKSNYFYKEQIAQETGMQADSICQQYNSIIASNIIAASNNTNCNFIPAPIDEFYDALVSKIAVTGEGDECNSNLTGISEDELQTMLGNAQADYMLVLNQHYLKWQSQPMRTVYHMVSYTLYDKNKKEICSGNQYFTSMNLQKPEDVMRLSRKSTSKIVSSVTRSLDL